MLFEEQLSDILFNSMDTDHTKQIQIVGVLVEEIFRLRTALEDIIKPFSMIVRQAEENGTQVSSLAHIISRDPDFLKEIAKKALGE